MTEVLTEMDARMNTAKPEKLIWDKSALRLSCYIVTVLWL